MWDNFWFHDIEQLVEEGVVARSGQVFVLLHHIEEIPHDLALFWGNSVLYAFGQGWEFIDFGSTLGSGGHGELDLTAEGESY